MSRLLKYTRLLSLLCIVTTCICLVLIVFPRLAINREMVLGELRVTKSKGASFDDEMGNVSVLGRWLLSPEGSSPPPRRNEKDRYLILIWKHGFFLERRHIRRFTKHKFSPWENCTVSNCDLSYESGDLSKASAVVFHLHLTRTPSDLPRRTRQDQRWIFLTDESPMHTFLYRNQQISDYNGLFNWSMTYRMDSDIPVPYGRAIPLSSSSPHVNLHRLTELLSKIKTKLVAVMGSNCSGNNGRWNYVRKLRETLNLDVYGRCLGGDTTTCPGHFHRDCPVLRAYKFYLAFENSNCREYITEKVFWHGYEKLAVPIIMGAPRKDCERLLPPRSFLHVDDFASPAALAEYIRRLDRNDEEYYKYHEWRGYYRVINEHGYFGSQSRHYCRICEALNYNSPGIKIYENMSSFWNRERDCDVSSLKQR